MANSWISLIGSSAGFCTTVAYLPQVLRIWRSRSTADISLGMFSVLTVGMLLWLVYGIARGDWALIVANGVTSFLAGTIFVLKLRHG